MKIFRFSKIATNGVFKIDAAAQLQGLPSMMNPAGGKGSTPRDMSKMGSEGKAEHVMKAIAKAGHDTEFQKAKDEVYAKLPACFQYDRPAAIKKENIVHDHDHSVHNHIH